jgi:hypothetical protein
MNLTNSVKTLSNEIKDLHQMKPKTNSQNGFISSRCIFFVYDTCPIDVGTSCLPTAEKENRASRPHAKKTKATEPHVRNVTKKTSQLRRWSIPSLDPHSLSRSHSLSHPCRTPPTQATQLRPCRHLHLRRSDLPTSSSPLRPSTCVASPTPQRRLLSHGNRCNPHLHCRPSTISYARAPAPRRLLSRSR